MSEPLLVRAARLEPTERTPVWFMRQAGRSLPEYREIRKTHTLFDVCYQPELCAEVTLQPVRRHDVDAAVMFADIMLPLLGMGVNVELVENVGPVIEQPIRSLADVERLTVPEPEESVPFILEAVSIVRRELRPDQAVIGFCGGPFTVAGYLIELGAPVADSLVPHLKDPDATIRGNVALMLGAIGSEAHVPMVQPLVNDRDRDVARAATRAIERLKMR